MVHDVPTTLVTGFLGAGKTTAILDLFAFRPPSARWAVLVNEFGEQGIDGAILDAGGLQVREVAGGCICCSRGLELKVALVRLLRDLAPDRLLVEPSGLSRPAAILDAMRQPGLREAISPRATIGVVDVRHVGDPVWTGRDGWLEQWQVSDVLYGTHLEQATPAQLQRFEAEAAASWPPKQVATALDPAWLDLKPTETFRVLPHGGSPVDARGWVWPATTRFDHARLEETLQRLVRPNPALPDGVLRIKGVFRTDRGWRLLNGTADRLDWRVFDHRADSRVEIVSAGASDWPAVESALTAAIA